MTIDHSPLVNSRPQWFQKMVELFFKDLSEVLTPPLLARSKQVFLKSLKNALDSEAEGLSFVLKRESEAFFEHSVMEQRTREEGSFGAPSRPTAGAQATAGAEATAGESETEETPQVFLKEESTMTLEGEKNTEAVDDLDFQIFSTKEDEGEEVEEKVIVKEQDEASPAIVETVRHLQMHSRDMYESTEGEHFECAACPERFQSFSDLEKHIMIHLKKRRFKCKLCSKKFSQCGSLKVHMRVHSGDGPYECHFCSKRFIRSQHLINHV
ncbi:unnamed protein product [Cyprideis torosa]|uniref:Uncharacterized protein n=1 Tax=Cyprideis torosa TaxID=163714 RepID=A0A7R8WDQ4_9CRUS|nr:unnamed protein product [Cyprideis torosa]CAG0889352.1 unnamed protein product [Cyprideis torosa]